MPNLPRLAVGAYLGEREGRSPTLAPYDSWKGHQVRGHLC